MRGYIGRLSSAGLFLPAITGVGACFARTGWAETARVIFAFSAISTAVRV